jgi:hypothetical protein
MMAMQPPLTHQTAYTTATADHQHLQQAEFVYIRKGRKVPPLSPLDQGPYRVPDRKEASQRCECG